MLTDAVVAVVAVVAVAADVVDVVVDAYDAGSNSTKTIDLKTDRLTVAATVVEGVVVSSAIFNQQRRTNSNTP